MNEQKSDERKTAEQIAESLVPAVQDVFVGMAGGTKEGRDLAHESMLRREREIRAKQVAAIAAAIESYAAERVAEEREAHLEILVMVRDYCQINNWTGKKIYKPVCEAIAAIRKRGSR